VEFFESLAPEDLDRVALEGRIERLRRGRFLFRVGDPPDRIHLLLGGAIEILRETPEDPQPVPVAYVTPGELLGDMALFTATKRRSSARVPERAETWTLTREAFRRIADTIPGYGMVLAGIFARRLEGFISHIRRQARRKELAGRLEYFDMPTVVQTLVSSNQTGVLAIQDAEGQTVADVLLLDGTVARARFGSLEGEDAFYEIFLRGAQDGEFVFRTVAEADPTSVSEREITRPAMTLLMEAMRLVDELPALRERLPPPDRPLQRRATKVSWDEEATLPVARYILDRLGQPVRLRDLEGEHPCTTHTLYDVAARLHEAGYIA